MEKEENKLDLLVLEAIREEKPENIHDLMQNLSNKNSKFSKSVILKHISELQQQGRITLIEESITKRGLWFWVIIVLIIITNLLVFLVSEHSSFLPVRWVVGYLFCFLIPGYSALKLLFPEKELQVVERLILSIALSLAIIPLVGLTVNFVVGSIALPYIMFSLSILTFALATVAYIKQG